MRSILFIISTLLFTLVSQKSVLAQEPFVYFETTNNSFVACENQCFGVIAKPLPKFKTFDKCEWIGVENSDQLMASLNTQKLGEFKVGFKLYIDNKVYDTLFVVKVRPNIKSELIYDNNIIMVRTSANIVNYIWIHNNELFPNNNLSSLENPSSGKYKVIITDSEGCSEISNEIIIDKR